MHVIIISKLLKRHSEAKCRAPAFSRALRQIRGVPTGSQTEVRVRFSEYRSREEAMQLNWEAVDQMKR